MRVYGQTVDLLVMHLEEGLLASLHVVQCDGPVAQGRVDELRLTLREGHVEHRIRLVI